MDSNKIREASTADRAQYLRNREEIKQRREKELEFLKSNYDGQIKNVKETGHSRVELAQNETNEQLMRELERKEKILNSMKNDLDVTTRSLQAENERLRTSNDNVMDELKYQHEQKFAQKVKDGSESLQTVNEKFNQDLDSLRHYGYLENEKALDKLQYNLRKTNSDYDAILTSNTQDYQTKVEGQENIQKHLLTNQELAFNNELRTQREQYGRQIFKERVENEKMLDTERTNAKNLKRDLQGQFEKSYSDLMQQHLKDFKALESASQKMANNYKAELKKTLTLADKKAESDFYRSTPLEPKLEEKPDAFIIKLAIPEHEVPGVVLSGKNRELKLNFSRSYNDEYKTSDGSNNTSKRYESFTKKFNVNATIASQKITKSYQDGEVIFTVPKA